MLFGRKRRYAGRHFPAVSSLTPLACLKGILWFPYSLYCMAGCAAAVTAIFLYRKLFSQDALTDSERNFDFSAKGTLRHIRLDAAARSSRCAGYGFRFVSAHRHRVGDAEWKISLHPGKTRMNGNLAVYGASGSMKTRSFCMNRILQSAARGESLIICGPQIRNSTKIQRIYAGFGVHCEGVQPCQPRELRLVELPERN